MEGRFSRVDRSRLPLLPAPNSSARPRGNYPFWQIYFFISSPIFLFKSQILRTNRLMAFRQKYRPKWPIQIFCPIWQKILPQYCIDHFRLYTTPHSLTLSLISLVPAFFQILTHLAAAKSDNLLSLSAHTLCTVCSSEKSWLPSICSLCICCMICWFLIIKPRANNHPVSFTRANIYSLILERAAKKSEFRKNWVINCTSA